MKNCGRRFHSEVAKFKFLNELVKVISPKVCNKSGLSVKATFWSRVHDQPSFWDVCMPVFKYLGDTLSEKVKMKVIAMLYSWTVALPDEAKISEAYHMLKSQGENGSNNSKTACHKDKITVSPKAPLKTLCCHFYFRCFISWAGNVSRCWHTDAVPTTNKSSVWWWKKEQSKNICPPPLPLKCQCLLSYFNAWSLSATIFY